MLASEDEEPGAEGWRVIRGASTAALQLLNWNESSANRRAKTDADQR